MMSREAVRRGYNNRNYVVGAHTPPGWAPTVVETEQVVGSLQYDIVEVTEDLVERLRSIAVAVTAAPADIVANTRDWWARTMIAETGGAPAAIAGVFVEVDSVEQVQAVMRLASEHSIPVTVSAGRSNVTGAALPLRGGIVLDVCRMNRVLGYDAESQIVDVEAGMFGDVFEEHVQNEYSMTSGHWPSSFGISTVGGWAACRGAGQLSTRYGKIEDMVAGMDVVLADGSLISVGAAGRSAVGSDLQQLFVGSEGTLGVITSLKIKLHRLPDYTKAIAFGFPSFKVGLDVCREILQRGAAPAALRLYDELESGLQFDLPDENVILIADEGNPKIVDAVIAIAEEVCRAFDGKELDGDALLERWYETRYLTGKSAEGFKRSAGFVADTLEMSGPWSVLSDVYLEVVEAVQALPGTLRASAHQSHAYTDAGCVYFSFRGEVEDPAARADWYRAAWDAANEVIVRHKATLSHHHGAGLVRAPYMAASLGGGLDVLRAIKATLDPQGILNPRKLGL